MAKILAHYVRVIYSNLLAHGSRNLWGVYFLLFFLVGSLFIYAVPAHAASVPQLINYQGVLTDRAGNRRNGPFDIRFSIWDNPTLTDAATHKVWPVSDGDEHIGVIVRRGVFSTFIGGGSASGTLGAEVFAHDDNYSSDDRYLQIEVKHGVTYEILWPRAQITTMGYAFNADRVQGQVSTDNIFPSSGDVGIGTTSPSPGMKLHVADHPYAGVIIEDTDATGPLWDDANSFILFRGSGEDLGFLGYSGIPEFPPFDDANLWLLNKKPANLYLGTDNDIQMTLSSDGNVGIGTMYPDPGSKLEVVGNVDIDSWAHSNMVTNLNAQYVQGSSHRDLESIWGNSFQPVGRTISYYGNPANSGSCDGVCSSYGKTCIGARSGLVGGDSPPPCGSGGVMGPMGCVFTSNMPHCCACTP